MMFFKYKAINPISILGLLLIAVTAICSTPLLSVPTYFVATGAVASILILISLVRKQVNANESLLVLILLFVLLTAGYKLFGFSSAMWGNYMNQWYFFVPLIIMIIISIKDKRDQEKWMWWMIVMFALVNIVININLSIKYPQIHTGRIYMDEELLATLNAGGTMFYNFVLMFFIVSFFVFLNTKMRIVKIVSMVASIIAAVYIVWYCLKGSVVVYFFLSIILLLISRRVKNYVLFLGVSVVSISFLLIIIEVYKDLIIDFLISHSPGERLSVRLITLIDVENEEANATTITGRMDRYLLSVKTWLSDASTFLFGIGDHRAGNNAMEPIGIGQHSDLLDTLARYGCLGGLIVGLFLNEVIKFVSSFFDRKFRTQLSVIFLVFLLCGFTKNIFYPRMGFIMFLFLPLSARFVNQQNPTK